MSTPEFADLTSAEQRVAAMSPAEQLAVLAAALGERFTSKFVYDADGCWLWTANVDCNDRGRVGGGQYWLGGRMYRAHRLAYETVVGPVPAHLPELDHFGGVGSATGCVSPLCIRPDHLRATTTAQNQQHRAGANRDNGSSGVRGVTWRKDRGKWQAHVQHSGRDLHGGYYDDVAVAELDAVLLRLAVFTHSDRDVYRLAELTGDLGDLAVRRARADIEARLERWGLAAHDDTAAIAA